MQVLLHTELSHPTGTPASRYARRRAAHASAARRRQDAAATALHPVLAEKLSVALAPATASTAIRREARLPAVPGKVHAVIGLRRTGKTTCLRQLVEEYYRRYSEWRGTETVCRSGSASCGG